MQVDDDIFHLGIINCALRPAAPSLFSIGIVAIDPDQIERIKVGEFKVLRIGHAAAHHEVEFLHRR